MKTLQNYLLLLALMLLMASCASTENSTSKEETAEGDGLNLTDEEKAKHLKAIENWKNKYNLGDSNRVISLDEIEDFLDQNSDMWKDFDTIMIGLGRPNWRDSIPTSGDIKDLALEESRKLMDSVLNIDITPNPTSSSVKLTFFSNFPAEYQNMLWPQDITVDLYYLNQKVHTFNFVNSYGVETIQEQYLQKDGMYRIVFRDVSKSFMVRK